mgnify:FL=1
MRVYLSIIMSTLEILGKMTAPPPAQARTAMHIRLDPKPVYLVQR